MTVSSGYEAVSILSKILTLQNKIFGLILDLETARYSPRINNLTSALLVSLRRLNDGGIEPVRPNTQIDYQSEIAKYPATRQNSD